MESKATLVVKAAAVVGAVAVCGLFGGVYYYLNSDIHQPTTSQTASVRVRVL
jgi:hypothetical protein